MQEFSVIVRARDSRHFKNVYSIPDSVEFLLTDTSDKSDKSWEPSAKRAKTFFMITFLDKKESRFEGAVLKYVRNIYIYFFYRVTFSVPTCGEGRIMKPRSYGKRFTERYYFNWSKRTTPKRGQLCPRNVNRRNANFCQAPSHFQNYRHWNRK